MNYFFISFFLLFANLSVLGLNNELNFPSSLPEFHHRMLRILLLFFNCLDSFSWNIRSSIRYTVAVLVHVDSPFSFATERTFWLYRTFHASHAPTDNGKKRNEKKKKTLKFSLSKYMLAFNILYWSWGIKKKAWIGSLKFHNKVNVKNNPFEKNFTVFKRHGWFRLVNV